MTNRRTATLILALLIGSVAALFAYMYVNSAQNRVFRGATLVPTLVADGPIAKGTSGEDVLTKGLLKADKVPEKYRPLTAVLDKNLINGKVAVSNIAAGQVLVEGMFVDPVVAQETAAKRVPAGQVAVTVQVDQVKGVAGLVTPGDQVNIMTIQPDGSQRTLFENVNVLYIGAIAAPLPGGAAVNAPSSEPGATPGANLVTFAVPQFAAEKIVYAAKLDGGIYLTLVPPGNKTTSVPPVSSTNLFTGGLTPYEG
ncbi:MAG TPA: Flp pilus assembly protein CpaB [Acidimicrobiales bacterium]|nr:Flp pilus assembly protein CpaB [Acidimicrobiales bacterium]